MGVSNALVGAICRRTERRGTVLYLITHGVERFSVTLWEKTISRVFVWHLAWLLLLVVVGGSVLVVIKVYVIILRTCTAICIHHIVIPTQIAWGMRRFVISSLGMDAFDSSIMSLFIKHLYEGTSFWSS